jgi:hypothetical protein
MTLTVHLRGDEPIPLDRLKSALATMVVERKGHDLEVSLSKGGVARLRPLARAVAGAGVSTAASIEVEFLDVTLESQIVLSQDRGTRRRAAIVGGVALLAVPWIVLAVMDFLDFRLLTLCTASGLSLIFLGRGRWF